MKKTIVVLALVLALVMSVFAGGGKEKSGASSTFQVPEGGYDGSAVTITFYHTMGSNLAAALDKKGNDIEENYLSKKQFIQTSL